MTTATSPRNRLPLHRSHGDPPDEVWEVETEQEAQLNLAIVLELCAAGALRCSEKTGHPSAATQQAVASRLVHGDFYPDTSIAAFAWPLLIRAGGLARNDGGRLRLTTKGRAAAKQPAADVLRTLWQRWTSHGLIDEFSRVEEVKGQRSRNVLTAVQPRREAVVTAVSRLPVDEWMMVDVLFAAIRRQGLSPAIARNQMARYKLYVGYSPEYGSLGYDDPDSWFQAEGRYILTILFEYAAVLGLIDVTYVRAAGARNDIPDHGSCDGIDALSRYDGLESVRLNRLGRYIVGQVDDYQRPTADRSAPLIIDDNLAVTATEELSLPDEQLLTRYADRHGDGWIFSRDSLLDAAAAGHPPEELTKSLRDRVDAELPTGFRVLIDDVTDRLDQLTDRGRVRLIECRDPALAKLLATDRTTKSSCRLIGDRQLAVPVEREVKFTAAVRKLGYVLPDLPS